MLVPRWSSAAQKTEQGRHGSAEAKTTHSFETHKARTEQAEDIRRLLELQDEGYSGIMTGPRTPVRKLTIK